uniref:Gram-positive cocci surface proteins LPxTG domain-containing protein n=1 Tax=Streptomyces sp. NBC_00049 TaxID=2903617 RepID=A0AAU2JQK6_9ACTN
MRTAVRTAIATAVLAGALLAPAGAAFAAAPQGAVAASSSVPDRQAGTPVSIDKGVVAVLRNKSEGPEAWIRAVSADWKPGDDYSGKVLAVLDNEHRSATVGALKLALVEGGTVHIEDLVVTKDGKSTSYRLPKGQGPECMSEAVVQQLGAGVEAQLTMSPGGPTAELRSAGAEEAWKTLNRADPSLPASDGIIARILNASSAEPVFEWKTQGGGMPFGHANFPKLPKGCTFDYTFQKPTEKPQPETKPETKPSPKPSVTPTTAAPKPQTAGQTSVVPKGGVAAGAEIAAEDTGASTAAVAGTGLAASLAALGGFVLLRRRRAAQG